MTAVVISFLGVGDAEIVARIHALCFDEDWDAATIKKVLAMPGAFGFTARADPACDIAGFALARIVADECELLSLGVAPNWRGLGVGGGLFDAAMVRACGLNAVRGLVSVGRRPDYYRLKNGQRTAALTMRCDLPV